MKDSNIKTKGNLPSANIKTKGNNSMAKAMQNFSGTAGGGAKGRKRGRSKSSR